MARALVRLPTQFDSAPVTARSATPSGACCSCCCCCIGSTLAICGYTAFSLGRFAADAQEAEEQYSRRVVAGAIAAGAAALPIALVGAAVLVALISAFGFLLFLLGWGALVGYLYRRVSAPDPWLRATLVVLIGGALFTAEFVAAVAAVDSLDRFVTVALIVGTAIVVLEYFVVFHPTRSRRAT